MIDFDLAVDLARPVSETHGPADSLTVTHLLFSFGTLRQPEVQLSLYRRRLQTTYDEIAGFRLAAVRVTDPAVIEASGTDLHPALVETGVAEDIVAGAVLEVGDDELAATDKYEEVSFRRISVTTAAGRTAWAYAPKPHLPLI